ncbi:L-threonine ammonia-lyase-like [Montipora foliosa]|uniref:L-threonine ammonia-lyase-like n=1 Tax=Montipora foliosa TaxID=591990 RepID=UPI0035F15A22
MFEDILRAADRIKQYIRRTPLEYSHWLSEVGNARVYVKLENEQITGSFKLRGAFNKLLSLKESKDEVFLTKGVIAASSGNHGAATAYASSKVGVPVTIYVPQTTSSAKVKAVKQFGGCLKYHGKDCVETEVKARADSEDDGLHFVSPYNDRVVVAGQGTIGVEVFQDLPEVDAVFVAVGGGGLIGGIAAYLKSVKPSVKMIGCQPAQSAVMSASVKAGKILDLVSGETLSDGTAGGVEENSVTFNLCKSLVDEWILVTEEEISKAVYHFIENHHKIIEGAAGVALAAYLREKERFWGQNVVIISCGGNISMEKLKEIILKWN